MVRTSVRYLLLLPVLALMALMAGSVGGSNPEAVPSPQIPSEFTNLQVLPKDIARRELIDTMRGFAIGLGVRCWHCHVGEGNDFATYDFPADTKAPKAVARKMLKMLMDINDNHLKGLDPEQAKGQRVQCITCHQKQEYPPEP